MSKEQYMFMEESKDTLALASKALDSAGSNGASDAPAKPGEKGGST